VVAVAARRAPSEGARLSLLELDPEERSGRLEIAVATGDVRADEVDEALRLVHRLDELRVMTIPPSSRLPGGIVPIIEYPVPEQKLDVTSIPVVSVDVVEAASLRITADLAPAKPAQARARRVRDDFGSRRSECPRRSWPRSRSPNLPTRRAGRASSGCVRS